ncbi:MAG: PEP-CTERM sorting domain-containing protein [Planctomycetales bacterium]|nr:PEP-CTERM sorting domain-containing protein [Planctomycetales bacterium]
MKILKTLSAITTVAVLVIAGPSFAATLSPLTSFGGGDGWLAPGEDPNLTTDNTQRGMTYNAANDHIYVVDRNGGTTVEIYNGTTGASVGSLDMTGLSGGVFLLNSIDVADDGAIYAANLRTNTDPANSATTLKIYRWANEAAAPTLAYNAQPGPGLRLGDTLAATGAGANTLLLAGINDGNGSSADPNVNSYAVFSTADGLNFSSTVPAFPSDPPPTGAHRLGIDFIDANSVLGSQTGASAYLSTFDLGAATAALDNEATKTSSGQAPLAYYAPLGLAAFVDINSSVVSLYEVDGLGNLVLNDSATTLTLPSVGNVNGSGDLKFGVGPGGDLRLYVLNTNNGIQAFNVVVPEPSTVALIAAGLAAAVIRRRCA